MLLNETLSTREKANIESSVVTNNNNDIKKNITSPLWLCQYQFTWFLLQHFLVLSCVKYPWQQYHRWYRIPLWYCRRQMAIVGFYFSKERERERVTIVREKKRAEEWMLTHVLISERLVENVVFRSTTNELIKEIVFIQLKSPCR